MGNLHLVTGYAGQPHVAAADQGSLFEALIRSGQFVMEAGANFAASIVSNNKIRVNDGELLMQGRHVKMTPGAYVDLAIANGAQGYLRNDLIVARYTRNAETGIEDCNLVVLKGTQVESNPADPEYKTGNLNADGALQHDFPLYRVPLSGLTVGALVPLFEPQKSLYVAMQNVKVTKAQVGLGNVDNTSDKNKPVSTAQKAYIDSAVGAAEGRCAPVGLVMNCDSGIYSSEALDDYINNMTQTLIESSCVMMNLAAVIARSFEPFNDTGTLFMTIYKVDYLGENMSVKAIMNGSSTMPVQYIRGKYNGEWGAWKTLTDDGVTMTLAEAEGV